MAPVIKARWIIRCNGCGAERRHVIPASERRSARFSCERCGPLDVDTSTWVVPKARNARDRWWRTWHDGGLWQTIHGTPRRT